MQADPSSPPVNVTVQAPAIDFGAIGRAFVDALTAAVPNLLPAIGQALVPHLPEIGTTLVGALQDALRQAAQAVWDAAWASSANIVTQIPADLTVNFGPYRAIATDPLPIAVGGATLALVLLGLRTGLGTLVGRDHVITHITGRLIPATFLTLAYPVLVARGLRLLNDAATGLGSVAIGQVVLFPPAPAGVLVIPFAALWLALIYYGLRLLIRLAYSLFRLLVALVFGPVALILWAIPQAEWVTWFWLRELLGWATTPLLVTACLALAIPLASGRGGFLATAVWSIAGFQAAYDLVGLLGLAHGRMGGLLPTGLAQRAAYSALAGWAAGGAAGAAASAPAMRSQLLADQFGFD